MFNWLTCPFPSQVEEAIRRAQADGDRLELDNRHLASELERSKNELAHIQGVGQGLLGALVGGGGGKISNDVMLLAPYRKKLVTKRELILSGKSSKEDMCRLRKLLIKFRQTGS